VLAHRRLLAGVLALLAVVLGLHAARPAAPATTPLVVARHDLSAGAVLTAADLTTIRVPPDVVPAGTQPHATGRVLATGLRRGEPITDLRLVGPALTAGHPELVAVPVRLPDAGMAALLRVGDRVRLLATDPQGGTTQTVAGDALVLALPAVDAANSAETTGANGVTSGLGGRLVVVGIAESLVTAVTSASVRDFLTYAYPN
jgi:Flp pilus assembly protein CpaB